MAKANELTANVGAADALVYGTPGEEIPLVWGDLSKAGCLNLPPDHLQRLRAFVATALAAMPCREATAEPTLVAKPPANAPAAAALARLALRGIPLRNAAMGLPEVPGLPFEARAAFSEDRTFLMLGDQRSGVILSWPGGRGFYEDPTPLGQLRALARDDARHLVIRPQPDLSHVAVDVGPVRRRAEPAASAPRPAAGGAPNGMRALREAGFDPSTATGVLCLRHEGDGFTMTVACANGRSVALAREYVGVVQDSAGSELNRLQGDVATMLVMLDAARTPSPRR